MDPSKVVERNRNYVAVDALPSVVRATHVNNSVDASRSRGFGRNTNIWSVIAHDKSVSLKVPILDFLRKCNLHK